MGGAKVGAADGIGRCAEGHLAEGFDFAFENLRTEIGDGAPGVQVGQLDVFFEGDKGHGSDS
ncbi:hypothetical protein D3C84_1192020 [compost metagenome]